MDETERNRSISWIVTITIGLLVAVLVGISFGFLAARSHFRKSMHRNDGGKLALSPATDAFIVLKGDKTCTQHVNGPNGVLYARPALSKTNGDSVIWHGGSARDTVSVVFANSGAFGPFQNTTYSTNEQSSTPTGGPSDYDFASVTVTPFGGAPTACSNFQGMGVHISN
jgi:hypothetical protein